jgi:hypothetical protein
LVTVTKSVPKKTPVTLSTAKMRRARGDFSAVSADGKISRAHFQHGLAGQEFQGRGVRCGFGLNEHGAFLIGSLRYARANREVKFWNDSKTGEGRLR